jgi:hypothetical protein
MCNSRARVSATVRGNVNFGTKFSVISIPWWWCGQTIIAAQYYGKFSIGG